MLARWSSWGAIPEVFDDLKPEWDAERTELRELLTAWRDAKRSAWKAFAGWAAALFLALMAVKLGFGEWVN